MGNVILGNVFIIIENLNPLEVMTIILLPIMSPSMAFLLLELMSVHTTAPGKTTGSAGHI